MIVPQKISLEKTLDLEPRALGAHIQSTLYSKLISEVVGTCTGRYGFIIKVIKVESIGAGKVMEGTGKVIFPIKYEALVFRPFVGQVLDVVVTSVNTMGFFSEAGPLRVFVSQKLIPMEMKFNEGEGGACYVSEDQEANITIEKDTEVRVKIIGMRVDANEIFAVGTIKEDWLGVISMN